jgi:hypothetical protein
MNDDKTKIREELRRKAESTLKRRKSKGINGFSEADHLKLLHELEVYQIELDLQDEELHRVKKEKEDLSQKYEDLSDLHTRFILHVLQRGKLN